MNKRAEENEHPQDLSAVWKEVRRQGKAVQGLLTALEKPSIWESYWRERNWTIAATFVVLAAISGALWHVFFLTVDSHINAALNQQTASIHADITTLQGDVREEKGIVSVLQAELANLKLSSVPTKDLKDHQRELTTIKNNLAAVQEKSPEFWSASAQVIALLSKSISGLEANGKPRLTLDTVSGVTPRSVGMPAGTQILLKGVISNSLFENAIIYFDPNVQLQNVGFRNCVLFLPAPANPSQPLQNIVTALLQAPELTNVVVKNS